MTDPRLLVRLDMALGLLGLVVALLALQVVGVSPATGYVAVLVLGLAAALGAFWYRWTLETAAE